MKILGNCIGVRAISHSSSRWNLAETFFPTQLVSGIMSFNVSLFPRLILNATDIFGHQVDGINLNLTKEREPLHIPSIRDCLQRRVTTKVCDTM
jgi:hypothetical protein